MIPFGVDDCGLGGRACSITHDTLVLKGLMENQICVHNHTNTKGMGPHELVKTLFEEGRINEELRRADPVASIQSQDGGSDA